MPHLLRVLIALIILIPCLAAAALPAVEVCGDGGECCDPSGACDSPCPLCSCCPERASSDVQLPPTWLCAAPPTPVTPHAPALVLPLATTDILHVPKAARG
jgi:hypothetical protein